MREKWDIMFKKLVAFKEQNKHCNVPAHRDKLGRWVERQRSQYAAKKLADDRVEALQSIGFQWKLQRQAKPRNRISTVASDELFLRWSNALPSMWSTMGMDGFLKRIKQTQNLAFGLKTDEVKENVVLSMKNVRKL